MTNREKLEAMSNGELASWLCGLMTEDGCSDLCPARGRCYVGHNSMAEWLKSEVEEEDA